MNRQADESVVFERRGFMTAAEPEVLPEGVTEEREVSAEEADKIMAEALPQVPGDGDSPEGEEVAGEEKVATKIRIGTREFSNQEDAWAYAQELEQEKIAADAFRHGVETATKGNPPPSAPQPDPDEKFDEEFYTNPKEYLKKRDERIAQQVLRQVSQTQTVTERNKQTWDKFYGEYPDLANAKELVQLTLTQNWDNLKEVETERALKIIAEKARDKRKALVADLLPGKELPRTKNAVSSGSGVRVTPQKVEEKNLTMVEQMAKVKRERAAKAR